MVEGFCKLCDQNLNLESRKPISVLCKKSLFKVCHDCARFSICPICLLSLLERSCAWQDSREKERIQIKAAGTSCADAQSFDLC